MSTIEQLLKRARQGDAEAREELFRAVEGPVLAIVRRRMGGHLRDAAESVDLAQSALGEAWRGLERFEHPGTPTSGNDPLLRWLARIVENKLRNEARKIQYGDRDPARRIPIEPDASNAPGFQPIAEAAGASTVAGHQEERQVLAKALQRLPDRELRLVRLRNLEGLPWSEVVERSGEATIKAAQACHARAMARLAGWLSTQESRADG